MKKFPLSKALVILSVLLVSLSSAYAQASSPRQIIAHTIDKLVQIVEQYPGEDNVELRREKLREVITPKFDFREMAKRSLGAHWNEIEESQQTEFVDAFSELLARTYLARIENVRSNMVTVDSEKVKVPKAFIKTTVTYKGDTFPIDYKLVKKKDDWKVYDVVIENIGLVANYRNEFAGIIRKEQFSGLMKRLHKKVAKNT